MVNQILFLSGECFRFHYLRYSFQTRTDSRLSDVDGLPYSTLLYSNGPGYANPRAVPGNGSGDTQNAVHSSAVPRQWATHGGEDVPIYAQGPMALQLFSGTVEQSYVPHAIAYAACIGPYTARCTGHHSDGDNTYGNITVFHLTHVTNRPQDGCCHITVFHLTHVTNRPQDGCCVRLTNRPQDGCCVRRAQYGNITVFRLTHVTNRPQDGCCVRRAQYGNITVFRLTHVTNRPQDGCCVRRAQYGNITVFRLTHVTNRPQDGCCVRRAQYGNITVFRLTHVTNRPQDGCCVRRAQYGNITVFRLTHVTNRPQDGCCVTHVTNRPQDGCCVRHAQYGNITVFRLTHVTNRPQDGCCVRHAQYGNITVFRLTHVTNRPQDVRQAQYGNITVFRLIHVTNRPQDGCCAPCTVWQHNGVPPDIRNQPTTQDGCCACRTAQYGKHNGVRLIHVTNRPQDGCCVRRAYSIAHNCVPPDTCNQPDHKTVFVAGAPCIQYGNITVFRPDTCNQPTTRRLLCAPVSERHHRRAAMSADAVAGCRHRGPLCATQPGYTLDITPQQLRGGSEIFTLIRTLYSCC
ncbi:hypothetical protein J6590_062875 [Homalodisca vitripennis]|nr:hypothetical protein J6590_062875 [Homalodisca vitripennis]